MNIINDTVKSFFQQHNYGNSSTKNLMMHCRPSVEKFVFSHLYERLYSMYKFKNCANDRIYKQGKFMVENYDSIELMKSLKIPKDFAILTEEEEKNGKIAYDSCIQIMNRIEKEISPGEKIKDLMRMYAEMKIAVVDYREGKVELQNLNDQIKVFGYIAIKADLSFPNTEFELLKDYLSFQESPDPMEEFIITNLQVFFNNIL